MNKPPTDSETLDAVHDALASVYRHGVVRYLVSTEGDVTSVEDLVDHLADREETPADRDHRHINIRLHHVTLPKLAAMGFIDYDDRRDLVRYRESPVLEQELQRTVDSTAGV